MTHPVSCGLVMNQVSKAIPGFANGGANLVSIGVFPTEEIISDST